MSELSKAYVLMAQEYYKYNDLDTSSRLVVNRKAESNELGWMNTWNTAMDAFIGKIGRVSHDIDSHNIGIPIRYKQEVFFFPFFVLSPAPFNKDAVKLAKEALKSKDIAAASAILLIKNNRGNSLEEHLLLPKQTKEIKGNILGID